jgi:hypothetical protein
MLLTLCASRSPCPPGLHQVRPEACIRRSARGRMIVPLAHSPRFQALLEKSRRSIRAGKGLTHKDFWKAVAQRRKSPRVSKNKNKAA